MDVPISERNDRVERGGEPKRDSAAEAALAADHAGKKDLVTEQKLADQQRKEGKLRSGVTKEFGSLILTGLESIGLGAAANLMRAALFDTSVKKDANGNGRTGNGVDEVKGSNGIRDIDPGFTPVRSDSARDSDSSFISKRSESAPNLDSGFTQKRPEHKDPSRAEVVDEKVFSPTASEGKGREFRYEGAQLTEVRSTYTGHTWKRSEVDGKEEWVNEKGTVWKGAFGVGPDGDLIFTPRDGKTAFVFTPDGKTLQVPVEEVQAKLVQGVIEAFYGPSYPATGVVSMTKLEAGTVKYGYKDGTKEKLHPNGEREVNFPDGSGYHSFPDGRKLVRHADGAEENLDEDGHTEWQKKRHPDGAYVVTDASGRLVEVVNAAADRHTTCQYGDNGNLTRIAGSFGVWTCEESWDGRIYWENGKTGEKFDGQMTVDKEGNVHQTPRELNAETRVWQLDGAEITIIRSNDNIVARDPSLEKATLGQRAETKITDHEARIQFQKDLREFEERAAKQSLSKEEIAETYRQVTRLLDFPGEQPVAEADRIKVVQQVMHLAAHPTECHQGYHNTCNVASIESRTYTRNPAAAAKLVADVATTGEFTTADGSVIRIDGNNLQKDPEALQGTHGRSYASQIFEVTAVNVHWQRETKRPYDERTIKLEKGSIRYEQRAPVPGMTPPDTGERLVDYSRNPPQVVVDGEGKPLHQPGLYPQNITEISNQITGKKERDMVITNVNQASGDSSITVGSEQALKDALAKAKERMPIIILVHTGNEPFFTDSGRGAAGGSGGWHVVNITDYDAANALVSVDNTWGDDKDRLTGNRRVSTADLYKATSERKST